MTTPGGVPNLPMGALTIPTLASKLQDMSGTAMRDRAAERMPAIFNGSSGGNPLSDLTPFGILTRIWAEFNSAVANADPADIQGPEDLPGLLLDFIESLPLVGELVGLLEAILGTYDGDDPVLLEIQEIFTLIRNILGGIDFQDAPTPAQAWQLVVTTFIEPLGLLLGPNSPLNAAHLFGQLRAALLGPLPIGMFTDEQLTLLREGGFDDPITIVPGSGYTHDATDGVPGSNPLGCARVECDGQWHIQSFALIKVAPGWTLTTPAQVKYESVVAAANSNAVRIELVPYNGTAPGAAVWMASDESPAGTVDWNDLNAWGQYVVPATGVTDVAVRTVVTPDATGGVVKFDNVDVLAIQKIPQAFTKDLPEDLASLLNFIQTWVHSALTALGITPSGVLLDDILDLSDELEFIQNRAEQGIADAAQALSDFTDFLSGGWQPLLDGVKGATGGGISDIINRLANITSGGLFDAAKLSAVTGTAPQSLITNLPTDLGSLQTTLNQIGEIFENNVVTPVNSIVSAIKDWWNAWFGGGSTNAIPLSQKGAANGVAPLNSSKKVATSYLETNVANGIPKLTGSGKLDLTYVETNGNNQLLKLDGSAKVPGANMPDLGSTYIAAGEKGAVNGVAPLNANAVVPLAYLPEEVGGSGGTGDGRPYVVLSKLASQSIPNSTKTLVTGWVQFGTASVTFENGTNGRWKFGLPGLWLIQFRAVWSTGATSGAQAAGITRQVLIAPTGSSGTPVELAVVTDFINPNGALTVGLNNYAACGGGITQRVSDWAATTSAGTITYGDDDWFGLKVRQNKGSAHDLIGVDPPNPETTTTVICTYLGAS